MKDKTQACEEQWAKVDLKINTKTKGKLGDGVMIAGKIKELDRCR